MTIDLSTQAYPLGERPAPSFPVGRLVSLGPEQDAADAQDILDVLAVWRRRQQRSGKEPLKQARETLDRWWEKRRTQRSSATGQNLPSHPWSPAARALAESGEALQFKLVLEHLWPARAVLGRVIAHLDQLDGPTLAQLLHLEMGYAVITKAEDVAVGRAGMRDIWLPDPWDRYRSLEMPEELRRALAPEGFRPLAS